MFAFQWHLTDRCNRRCRHCYQHKFRVSGNELLPKARKEAAEKILAAIPDEPVTINLTGGEPMILPDLLDLMRYLESFENLAEIGIITNGTIVDPKLLAELAEIKKFTTFLVSIESNEKAVNDQIRGEGALKAVTDNIELYKAVTGRKITLMMTLSKLNLNAIEATTVFARLNKADAIMFERFIPMGTGKKMKESVLSAAEWRQAVNSIGQAAGIDLDPYAVASCRAFLLNLSLPHDHEDVLEAALCNLGPDSMALMPDGEVFPCRRLNLSVGNLMVNSFAEIRSKLAVWECGRLRQKLTGEICGLCPYEDCPGCRALARVINDDVFADDPQCVLHD
jgi:radical SAM protein with 4Fe4S-binding SPASM domain